MPINDITLQNMHAISQSIQVVYCEFNVNKEHTMKISGDILQTLWFMSGYRKLNQKDKTMEESEFGDDEEVLYM